jgi:hypothetical protein
VSWSSCSRVCISLLLLSSCSVFLLGLALWMLSHARGGGGAGGAAIMPGLTTEVRLRRAWEGELKEVPAIGTAFFRRKQPKEA